MNCDESHLMLSRGRDEPLAGPQQRALDEHLAHCSDCREFQYAVRSLTKTLQAELDSVATPDADQEWRLLRSRLQQNINPAQSRRLIPLLWIGAPLAAAVALLFFIPQRTAVVSRNPAMVASLPDNTSTGTQVEYVNTGDTAATTLVYVDKASGWLVVWADVPADHAKG